MSNVWMANVWDLFELTSNGWVTLGRATVCTTPEKALAKLLKQEVEDKTFRHAHGFSLAEYNNRIFRAVNVYDFEEWLDDDTKATYVKKRKPRKTSVCMDCGGVTGSMESKRCGACYKKGRNEGRIDSRGNIIPN